MKRILVIGGGIGGLCTALMLQKQGFAVSVYEAADELKPVGAGLGVGSNALRALNKAGVGEEIERQGNRLESLVFQNEKGKELNRLDLSVLAREFGLNSLTIHRHDLHRILLGVLHPDTVHLGKRCTDFQQDGDIVNVRFADGSEASGDLLIAADGIHSFFRQRLVDKSAPRYAGYTCWRGVVENQEGLVHPHISYELWGKEGRVGMVPLQGNQIYWFACINASFREKALQQLNPAEVAALFPAFPVYVRGMLASTDPQALLHHDMQDIQPLSRWAFGRIVLLGDAAHATTPNMGQGAGQALEDAIVLARCLEEKGDLQEALRAYEKERMRRTAKIIRMSRQIGVVAQWENRAAIALRNTLFRMVPPRLLLSRFRFLLDVDL